MNYFITRPEFWGWLELTEEELDELSNYGDAVAEGRMTADEGVSIARREYNDDADTV